MKVVHSIYSVAVDRGGPARVLRDLTVAQAGMGAEVHLVTGDEGAPDGGRIVPDAAMCETVFVPNLPRLYFPGRAYGAAIAERLNEADAILHDHGVWLPCNWVAARAARRAGRPYVVSPHGSLNPWAMAWHGSRKKLVWRLYQQRILAGAAALVATSEDERAAISALFPGKPVAMIPNGVSIPAHVPDRGHIAGRTERRVLFMSRLHPVKNIPGLLDAWATVKSDPALGAWQLDIAGPDELGERAAGEARAAQLGIADSVHFHGAVDEQDKPAWFAASDLFILPSFTENFGIVVAEALGHGVPAIATHGAPWADLPRLDIGWHVEPTGVALAAALSEAMHLDDPARLAKGARGHRYVAANFGWDRIAGETLALYRWVLSGGTRPGFVDG